MFKRKNLKVLVMGLGLHGGAVAVARFFAEEGADIIVTDLKTGRELRPSVEALSKFKNIRFHLGGHLKEDFNWAELIIPSPAVPYSSLYLRDARKRGVPVLNEAALFFLLSKRKIIGVTGTRGKSTTASLIYHFIKKRYPKAILAGNIRDTAMFSIARDAVKKIRDPIVLELSSWHLEGLEDIKKSPQTAVITNLFPEHLNRYKTLRDYYNAKAIIFKYQKPDDVTFLNYDSKPLRGFSGLLKGKRYWFSLRGGFSGSGITIRDNNIIWKDGNRVKKLFKSSDIDLEGEHNIYNILVAAGAAYKWDISGKAMRNSLASFKTLNGRQEFIAVKRGIKFYNDTTATSPEATIAFLDTVSEPVTLIMGGSDKKLSYAALAKKLKSRAKGVVLLPGEASNKLEKELNIRKNSKLIIKKADNIKSALSEALKIASRGEIVALSPAAASFGLFKHEFDRGSKFLEAVNSL